MSFNMEGLKRVEKANTRSSTIDYDLAYSEKTGKFRVSQEFYDKIDMQNHGLTAIEDLKEGKLYIAAEPNEKAVMHKGRGGDTEKGREFTASRLRAKLDDYGFKGVNEFTLDEVHQEGDMTVFSVQSNEEGETAQMGDDRDIGVVPEESQAPATQQEEPANETSDDEFSDEAIDSILG